MITDAKVILWGKVIGAVSWLENRQCAVFQYEPTFSKSGIQVSPLKMPLRTEPFEFPELSKNSFKGMPGLLADSLPDHYGNAMIDAWLVSQGRNPQSFTPIERLCYIGKRGMGALEFEPTISQHKAGRNSIELSMLVELANDVLSERTLLKGKFGGKNDKTLIEEVLRVGTSAGGARAKAILAWNPKTGEFRSGQLDSDPNFEHWLVKFDGVSKSGDHGVSDPKGFGLIEFAYYQMAKKAGIEMSECRIHSEGGRHHFMTKRFDRTDSGNKKHMQSLTAIAHFDYQNPALYSYEQCFDIMRRLKLSGLEMEQQFRRTLFNVVARNQDDHVKNSAFLMDKSGTWKLSPAFDVSYSWNPDGIWTSNHQMSINQKRNDFTLSDLLALGEKAGIKPRKSKQILEQVIEAVNSWSEIAKEVGVPKKRISQVQKAHRMIF